MIKYYEGDGRLSLVTEHNGVLYLTGRTSDGKDIKEQTQGVLNIIDETLAKYNSDKGTYFTRPNFFERRTKRLRQYERGLGKPG